MKIACPYCQLHLDVEPHQGGAETNCPSCDGRFQVPLPQAHPMPPGRDAGNQFSKPESVPGSFNQPGYSAGGSPEQVEIKNFANKKIAAGICGILLGALGVHKFILGFNSAGVIMLSVYLLCMFGTCIIFVPILGMFSMQVIGIVEGILYLTKSDEEFYQAYAIERREWF